MEIRVFINGENGCGICEVEVWRHCRSRGGLCEVRVGLHFHVGRERKSEPVIEIAAAAALIVHGLHLSSQILHTPHTLLNHWGENRVIISCLLSSLSQGS